MNFPPGVEIELLIRIFVVDKESHWVAVTSSKLRRCPPTVRRTRKGYYLCVLIESTTPP